MDFDLVGLAKASGVPAFVIFIGAVLVAVAVFAFRRSDAQGASVSASEQRLRTDLMGMVGTQDTRITDLTEQLGKCMASHAECQLTVAKLEGKLETKVGALKDEIRSLRTQLQRAIGGHD